MASAQDIARRIRSNSSHSKESVRGPIKATSPVYHSDRRVSEVVLGERPQSRRSHRKSSYGGLDDVRCEGNSEFQYQRPGSSRSLDGADVSARRARMMQRQNATTVDPEERQQYTPRPPSSRPQSAKGRPRSRSGRPMPSQSRGSDIIPDHEMQPKQLQQQCVSFSRYTPLPSIGTRPQTPSGMECQTHNTKNSDDVNINLAEKYTNMHIKRTIPPEPGDSEPDRIQLALRLLDGSRHERWFHPTDTIQEVLCFAGFLSKEMKLLEDYVLCTNDVPRKVFEDPSLTLCAAGLESRTVLHVQEK
ncbi:uncharacterized protein LOC5509004 [Nematostella vectensis]|uniref:uncharacterized protein LOC5509004 n=1 Tax=Nematostella vectensis TaxID=45351 RepID=UPI0020773D7F|nr:uncharacterized protein LOC5509004 [Nematostella vectensis]